MTWTVIYREPTEENTLTTTVIHGPWGKSAALSYVAENIKGNILAIVAGDQVVHFNYNDNHYQNDHTI